MTIKKVVDNSHLFKNKKDEVPEVPTADNPADDTLAPLKLDIKEGVLVYLDSNDVIKVEMKPLKSCRKMNANESLVLINQAADFLRMQMCLSVMGEHLEKRLAQVLGNHSELPKVDGTAGETKEPH